MKPEEIKERLARLKKEREALEIELSTAEQESRLTAAMPFMHVAVQAHDLLCQYNHTDGCGWGYETVNGQHNWGLDGQGYSAHRKWLENVMEVCRELNISHQELGKALEGLALLKKDCPQVMRVIAALRRA